jgi:hypothetical protein
MWKKTINRPPTWELYATSISSGLHNTIYGSRAIVSKGPSTYYAIVYIDTISPGWHFEQKYISNHFDSLTAAKRWARILAEYPPDYIQQLTNVFGTVKFNIAYDEYLKRKDEEILQSAILSANEV